MSAVQCHESGQAWQRVGDEASLTALWRVVLTLCPVIITQG